MVKRAKIEVAVVIPKFGLIGGAEGFSFESTTRIADSGEFSVSVYAQNWRCDSSTITFRKIPRLPLSRILRPIFFALNVERRLKAVRPDVIHTHERIIRSDLFTFHGIPHRTWISQIRRKNLTPFDMATAWVERRGIVNQNCWRILPVSNLVREELLKVYSIPEDRMQVIHPGVSIERFNGSGREEWRSGIRKQHGLGASDLVVLFVGMNFEVKGLETVLKGIAQASRETRPKLMVIGKGNSEKYLRMAGELGIRKQVVFAGVTSEVEKYYQACDIFTMPSHFDAFGLVVLEAMASGLPVIVSKKVGAVDAVQDGLNGFILKEPEPASSLGKTINKLSNEAIRLEIGKRARETASLFTWNRTSEQIAELYRRCAEDKQNGKLEFGNWKAGEAT